MLVTVANKSRYRSPLDRAADASPGVSITAPSPLATPFKKSKALDRESMVVRYAAWLDDQLADPDSPAAREFARLRALLDEHGALTLLCACAPLPCHGDAIRERLLATPLSPAQHGHSARSTAP